MSRLGIFTLVLFSFCSNAVMADRSFFILSEGGTPNTFFCYPQPFYRKTDSTWNINNQTISLIREDSSVCRQPDPENTAAEELVLNPSDLNQVAGKVALIQGSKCNFTSYYHYMLDYRERANAAVINGAIGVIFAESHRNKLPEHIVEQEAYPVCMLEAQEFDRLVQSAPGWSSAMAVSSALPDLTADFTHVYLYTRVDDVYNIPVPELTSISVNEQWYEGSPEGLRHPVPAISTTFNPDDMPQTSGKLVEAVWTESCASAVNFLNCSACWREDSPFQNSVELVGAVAFMNYLVSVPYCYFHYWHWATLVQRAGAAGLVVGVPYVYNFYNVPSNYLVLDEMSISTYKIPRLYAEILDSMITEADPQGVRMQLPEVVEGAAPVFLAEESQVALDYTVIGLFTQEDNQQWSSFYCDAGQATYNPWTHPGISPPDFEDGSEAGLITHAWPVDVCMSWDTCVDCLKLNQDLNLTRLQQDRKSQNPVMLFDLQDWVCHASFHHLTEAAQQAGASAVIIMNDRDWLNNDLLFTMAPTGTEASYRSPIPSFNIPRSCGLRIEQADHFHAALPAIANGSAVQGDMYHARFNRLGEHRPLDTTIILSNIDVERYSDACTKCIAGQADYNPQTHRSVQGSVLPVRPAAVCVEERECLECDRKGDDLFVSLASQQLLTSERVQGKVVFVDVAYLYCVYPFSNVVLWFQTMGAAALVFVNTEDSVITMSQAAIPFNVTIPVFNIGQREGRSLIMASMLEEGLFIRTPRLEQGVAVADSAFSADLGDLERSSLFRDGDTDLTGTDSSDGGSDDNIGLIIGLAVVGVFSLAVFGGTMYWFCKRQKALHAYNQFDMACQTGEAFMDLMSPGGDDSCGGNGFDNHPTRIATFEISDA